MNRQQELLAGNSAVNYEKFETWARAGPKDTPAEQGTGAGKNGDLMGFVWILYIYITIYGFIWIYMDLKSFRLCFLEKDNVNNVKK
jgi:hypothetical protein